MPVTSSCVIGNVSMVVKGKDEIEFFRTKYTFRLVLWVSRRICAMSRVVIEEDGRIERGDLEQKVFCRPCALSP